eukprot:scaffold44204_cov41-Cyclotella_meneghiniana.AAC.3
MAGGLERSVDGSIHGPKLGGNDRVHKRIPNEEGMGEDLRREEGRASPWLETWMEASMVMYMANNLGELLMAKGRENH